VCIVITLFTGIVVVVVVDVEVVVDVVVDEVAEIVVEVTELETGIELSLIIFVICSEEVSEFCEHANNKIKITEYFFIIFYSSS
tara:strand:- start:305 stop:556 length:252 start_codon:yes stop_codon:yes gene_type:complete